MSNPVYPCLWFNNQAKPAADFYCTVFAESRLLSENEAVVTFELNGTRFIALNGGPQFKINEAVSFVIECKTQEEVDHYWRQLTGDGGEEGNCGWLKDKFGVSWQVVPAQLGQWMGDPDRAPRVIAAFSKMKKLDIATLESA